MPEPVGFANSLFALFGIARPQDADLPTAPVSLLGGGGDATKTYIMHADPLHLVPDQDWVLAFGLGNDPLTGEEIAELVGAFNRHFGDEGLLLFDDGSGGLFLSCETTPSLRTSPLDAVIGRRIDRYLPQGRDQRRWRGLLNETQMLCYGLDGNRAREARGRLTLGGLWFSGGGVLPEPGTTSVRALDGDSTLARGLLALSTSDGEDEVVVDSAPWDAVLAADATSWVAAVADLDARLPALQQGCEALVVHPGEGAAFWWRPRSDWRLWRRQRRLLHYAAADGNESGHAAQPRV